MNFIKRNWQKLILVIYAFIVPVVSFAQNSVTIPGQNSVTMPNTTTTCPDGSSAVGRICNPLAITKTLPDFIKNILNGAVKIGIPIIALAIIYCGFLFVKAQGKPEEITKAKDALLYTLIGAAILLGALAIAQMISSTVLAL